MNETRSGGLYIVNGRHVDAKGEPVENPPAITPDTPASEQPGGGGVVSSDEKLAVAVATAVAKSMIAAQASTPVADVDAKDSKASTKPDAR